MPRVFPAQLYLITFAGIAACARDQAADTSQATTAAPSTDGPAYAYNRIALDTARSPGTVIDSALPIAEAIRRFRKDLADPAALVGGAASRTALVEAFVAALSRKDSKALGRLAMSRAEFAYLYYPSSRDATAPNGMPPTVRWDLLTLASEKGIGRALERLGGQPLTLVTLACDTAPAKLGELTLHDGCTVRIAKGSGQEFDGVLFGSILELRGRFKFIGYANDM